MIPRTYPSTFAFNGQQQMLVHFLTDVTGLQRWLDYIPVKLSTSGKENSYDNNGYIDVTVVTKTATMIPFKDYVPVYSDPSASDAWQVNSVGYIPYGYAGFGTGSLMLDMTNGSSLDPRITFTRASNATVVGPTGALETRTNNQPRFDYDPVTLAPKGLLIEEQRTNSIRNNTMQGAVAGTPGTLPTNWATTPFPINGLSQTIAGIGSENGIAYMDIRISGVTTAVGATVLYFDSSTTTATAAPSQVWSTSAYFKVAAGSTSNILTLDLTLRENDSATSFLRQTLFNCISVGSVLTRYSGSATTGVSTAFVNTGLRFSYNIGAAIDITLRIGMPQLEQGAFATSVIPTTTAAATRAADVAVMTGANFSNWYNQSEGTLFAEALTFNSSVSKYPWAVHDGSQAELIAPYFLNANGGGFVVDGSVTQAQIEAAGLTAVSKIALAVKANDFALSINGSTVSTDTSGTMPTPDRAQLGNRADGNRTLNGHIRRIAYFPRRLTNAELQTLTT